MSAQSAGRSKNPSTIPYPTLVAAPLRSASQRQGALQCLQVGVGHGREQVDAVAAGQRGAQVAPHGRRAGVEPQRARVVARRRVVVAQARLRARAPVTRALLMPGLAKDLHMETSGSERLLAGKRPVR